MTKDTLSVTDNRTGRTYEIPIEHNTIRSADLAEIRASDALPGLRTYDPAFSNTAACKSRITFIDGDKGILRYRGYPIDQLANQSNYLECAYLIIKGELPTSNQINAWTHNITLHTMVHENIKKFMEGFRYDAHPMGMLIGTIGAMSTFYPDASDIFDIESRRLQTRRLIGKLPTLAAFAYRRLRGLPYVYPDNELSYTGNFLSMMFRMTEQKYRPNPVLERALEVLFILHADHEQNCSTNALRCVASSLVDPFSAVASATAALYGPRHGGANEAVVRMLQEIGRPENVPAYVKRVKAGEMRLMGFGHRIYKNYDPRAEIIKELAHQVFAVTGHDPLIDIALELERIALDDEHFVQRKLYPNVDFYSGIIYQAMNIPQKMFPVMFAIPRTCGWLAHWAEFVNDKEQRIARPRQIYLGSEERAYLPLKARPHSEVTEDMVSGRI
jgi:citrate synthase